MFEQDGEVCHEHSGVVTNLKSLRSCAIKQREDIDAIETRVNGITSKLNVILGGIVVSIFMLLLNIIFKID